MVLGIGAIIILSNMPDQPNVREERPEQPPTRHQMLMEKTQGKVHLFNTSLDTSYKPVGLLSFSLRNDSPVKIKDLAIICEFFSETGTSLGAANTYVYRFFPPHDVQYVRNVKIQPVPEAATRHRCWLELYDVVEEKIQ